MHSTQPILLPSNCVDTTRLEYIAHDDDSIFVDIDAVKLKGR